MADFDLSDIGGSDVSGLDSLFEREDHLLRPHYASGRTKVASLGDLSGFIRLSSDTLIHKSDRDLWALKKEGESYYVERLFDDQGEPLRG